VQDLQSLRGEAGELGLDGSLLGTVAVRDEDMSTLHASLLTIPSI
jgi:hypothetical protein